MLGGSDHTPGGIATPVPFFLVSLLLLPPVHACIAALWYVRAPYFNTVKGK